MGADCRPRRQPTSLSAAAQNSSDIDSPLLAAPSPVTAHGASAKCSYDADTVGSGRRPIMEFYRTGAGGFDSMDGPSVVLVHGTREDGLASSTGAPRSAQIWCVASSSLQSTVRARTASTAGHLRSQAPWALRRSVPRSTPACSSPRPVRQGRPPCARLDVGPRRGHRLGSLGQRSRVRPAPGRPNHAALLRMAGITHPGLVAKGTATR
jgi:hypothetical protein